MGSFSKLEQQICWNSDFSQVCCFFILLESIAGAVFIRMDFKIAAVTVRLLSDFARFEAESQLASVLLVC